MFHSQMLDTAKGITEKKEKKSKSSFPTIFRKAKSRDPSPNNARTRSTEYSSLDRKNVSARTGHLDRKKKSPSKTNVPPVSDCAKCTVLWNPLWENSLRMQFCEVVVAVVGTLLKFWWLTYLLVIVLRQIWQVSVTKT